MTIEKQIQNLEADRLVEIFGPILKLLLSKLERVAFVHNLLISVLSAGKRDTQPAVEGEQPREKAKPTRGRSQSTFERHKKQISKVATSPTLSRAYLANSHQGSLQVSEKDIQPDDEETEANEPHVEDLRGGGLNNWMDKVNLEITEEYRNQVIF